MQEQVAKGEHLAAWLASMTGEDFICENRLLSETADLPVLVIIRGAKAVMRGVTLCQVTGPGDHNARVFLTWQEIDELVKIRNQWGPGPTE